MTDFAARPMEGDDGVTSESLIKHFKRYGLDNAHAGYRNAPAIYKSYKTLREDSLVLVARTYMPEDTYAIIIGVVGYPHFEQKARQDWKDIRGLS